MLTNKNLSEAWKYRATLLVTLIAFSVNYAQAHGANPVKYYLVVDKEGDGDIKITPYSPKKIHPSLLSLCIPVDFLRRNHIGWADFNNAKCVDTEQLNGVAFDRRGDDIYVIFTPDQPNSFSINDGGYMAPSLWNEGTEAALLNYDISSFTNYSRQGLGTDTSRYMNLSPGINIGAWRFRSYVTYNKQSTDPEQWSAAQLYLQRDVLPLTASVTLGDSTLTNGIFNDINLRGVQLVKDAEMQPASQQGYAPVIRGSASTNARITVSQGGYIIYQRPVSPGIFSINDISPVGTQDFQVTVKESDGTEKRFNVPYSSMAMLLRPGSFNYALAYGTYRDFDENSHLPPFTQGTLSFGFPSGVTVYTGFQKSSSYQSGLIGTGKDLGNAGAISVDRAYSMAHFNNDAVRRGEALRLKYQKNIALTNSHLTVSYSRFSPGDFYSLNTFYDSQRNYTQSANADHLRQQTELSYEQDLWNINAGFVGITFSHDKFSSDEKKSNTLLVSYNNSLHGITYNVQYSRTTDSARYRFSDDSSYRYAESEQSINFNISVPMSSLDHPNVRASYAVNSNRTGQTGNTVRLSGSTLQNDSLIWDTSISRYNHEGGYSGNINIDYLHPRSEIYINSGYDTNSYQFSAGLRGGAVLHENGLTLSQYLGETIAVVKAKKYSQMPGGTMADSRGYTIIPWLTPFRRNDMGMYCPELEDPVCSVNQIATPTRGAVVNVDFTEQASADKH